VALTDGGGGGGGGGGAVLGRGAGGGEEWLPFSEDSSLALSNTLCPPTLPKRTATYEFGVS
jgi:hypothetical protein